MSTTTATTEPRLCRQCGTVLIGGRKDRRFCDKYCAADYAKAQWRHANPKSPLAAMHNGAVAEANEMRVAIDLLKRGYEVYRAAFPAQPCDMVIRESFHGGFAVWHRIEVTTGNRTASGTVVHPKRDKAQFDVLAVVIGDDIIYKPDLEGERHVV